MAYRHTRPLQGYGYYIISVWEWISVFTFNPKFNFTDDANLEVQNPSEREGGMMGVLSKFMSIEELYSVVPTWNHALVYAYLRWNKKLFTKLAISNLCGEDLNSAYPFFIKHSTIL